jgi:serine/threonine-protein kinase
MDGYNVYEQLGNKGKEGITYLVSKDHDVYAMKTFRKNKSSKKLLKESSLQQRASDYGIAPNVFDVNIEQKYIVMDKLDKHLLDYMRRDNGNLKKIYQLQIINILKTLDNAKVFHGDSNILNYMMKGKKMYIIDFGMAKKITKQLEKKLGTTTPNIDITTLGIVLNMKEMNCPSTAYKYLLRYIPVTEQVRFNLV